MKILAIRGKNLASLAGEFEIDFRREPLKQAGLFAITGKTGSGKTTILDAMCIALYEKSPRLEDIRNSNAIENNLQENNPRTILRRGSSEGYAEVDFMAVDGYEYRVRWSISRTRNNPNGNFRPTSYDLYNLSTGEHQALTATDHKREIPLLTGLTYEQFTRAVLLAQGKFSAFLKADENEKATILQTLTGTEIYSRISALIYSRYGQAKKELELVEEKKRGLVILTKEEIDTLNTKMNGLQQQQLKNEKEIQVLTAQKQWIERMAQLQAQHAEAMKRHAEAVAQMQACEPLIKRAERIDSIQPVRDTFIQKVSIERQRAGHEAQLNDLKVKLQGADKELTAALQQSKEAESLQKKTQEEYDAFKPIINEALKVEEQTRGCAKRAKEINENKERLAKEYATTLATIDNSRKEQQKKEEESKSIAEWFEKYKEFAEVIPAIPGIVANIQAIESSRKQMALREKTIADATVHLAHNEKRLAEVTKRKEELARTLTSEIAALRGRLVEGEPCPVCGSTHHTLVISNEATLAEKELEIAKEEVRKDEEYLTRSIEGYRNEISGGKGIIETLGKQVEELHAINMSQMQGVSNANCILTQENSAIKLSNLATEWKKRSERLTEAKEILSVIAKSLELSTVRATEQAKELQECEKTLSATNGEAKDLKERLTQLLGDWKTTENAEREFGRRIAEANRQFSAAAEKRASVADIYNRLKGSIEEKTRLIASNDELHKRLTAEVDSYLEKRDDGMSIAELAGLIEASKDIQQMRSVIEKATKAVTESKTTVAERERGIEEHLKSDTKPLEQREIKDIEEEIARITALRKTCADEISAINATLLKDKENNSLFAKYRAEYEAKESNANNWAKLNAVFGSAKGEKLMRLAQGYTLDILLDVANSHLKEFSGRYMLSRISRDSLGIKVIDLEMMSDCRSVHTLSGGETFLTSLAMSLALSTISSNRMSINSLFIDEGFGALDSETLKSAMDALEQLQNQGRKIGVISHLNEMIERIPTRITVTKNNNGKSRIEII